jgi:hypothetical protein
VENVLIFAGFPELLIFATLQVAAGTERYQLWPFGLSCAGKSVMLLQLRRDNGRGRLDSSPLSSLWRHDIDARQNQRDMDAPL